MKTIFQWLRAARREIRLLKNSCMQVLARWQQRYAQASCPHQWQPARIQGEKARYCALCDTSERLTPEMYFAHFGERGW